LAVNTRSSQTAAVTVTAKGVTANTTFTVQRAPVEVYVSHKSVKRGGTQTVYLFGPRRTRAALRILYPGGLYVTHTLTLDPHGHATYSFHLPKTFHKTPPVTVTVEAEAKTSAGPYVATATFRGT
jgi:hypothetical protein